ncbi:MAG: hypothetical protein AB1744_09390 [Candidatus Zixiibacteriota bacterium]
MYCAYCEDEILGQPVRRNGEYYCSVECAEQAADIGLAEPDDDDDDVPEGLYDDEE